MVGVEQLLDVVHNLVKIGLEQITHELRLHDDRRAAAHLERRAVDLVVRVDEVRQRGALAEHLEQRREVDGARRVVGCLRDLDRLPVL